jgi:hypothetical protein
VQLVRLQLAESSKWRTFPCTPYNRD